MRVLVTGASGFVGSHIIGALIKAGYLVRGLTRKMPSQERERLGAEYIDDVDVTESLTLLPAMFQEVDAIVHLVGIIREGVGSQSFQRVHVDGMRNLLDAAGDSGFQGQVIYLSALGADPASPSEYSRTKYAAEQILVDSGFPGTIFRPSLILGRGGEFVQQIQDLVLHGGLPLPVPMPFIPMPGSGETRFQPLAIGDLAACIVRSLENATTSYQMYEVGGASIVTFNQIIEGFARHLGVQKPVLHVPLGVLSAAAAVMEAMMTKPLVTRDQLINLGRDNVTDSQAVENVFKVRPLTFDQILDLIFAK